MASPHPKVENKTQGTIRFLKARHMFFMTTRLLCHPKICSDRHRNMPTKARTKVEYSSGKHHTCLINTSTSGAFLHHDLSRRHWMGYKRGHMFQENSRSRSRRSRSRRSRSSRRRRKRKELSRAILTYHLLFFLIHSGFLPPLKYFIYLECSFFFSA